MEEILKEIQVEGFTIIQKANGIEILKDKEVFGIFLSWETLKAILQSLHTFCDPEIEEIVTLLEKKTPS